MDMEAYDVDSLESSDRNYIEGYEACLEDVKDAFFNMDIFQDQFSEIGLDVDRLDLNVLDMDDICFTMNDKKRFTKETIIFKTMRDAIVEQVMSKRDAKIIEMIERG